MISGNNIFLRAVELEDARIISAWLNDRETNRYLDITYPLSKRYADSYVYDADEDKSKKTFIIDNPGRKPIGLVVIENIKWEYRNCEVGIVIYDKNQRGKGYGKDALETVVKFIFDEMNMHLAYLNVLEENEAAIKLYKSVGFEIEGVLKHRYFKEGKYKNIVVMSKLKTT